MERIEAMEYFWLLTALPLFGLLLLLRLRWSRQLPQRLGEGHDLQQLFPGSSFRRSGLKNVLMALVLLSLVLGIANPQTGSKMESVQREGIDLIFAVDVSKSMLAEDVAPSRLARARQLVSACVDELGGDRVGLIAYAGEAFPQLPITTDHGGCRCFSIGSVLIRSHLRAQRSLRPSSSRRGCSRTRGPRPARTHSDLGWRRPRRRTGAGHRKGTDTGHPHLQRLAWAPSAASPFL